MKNTQAKAKATLIRVSPQKLSLVASMVRKMPVQEALLQLQFCKKAVSKHVYDVLYSAISNAEHNLGLDIDSLVIDNINVGKAKIMKRHRARARGRSGKIQKLFSNLEITLREVC